MSQLPEKIGKYPIVGVAGKGNMGIVYVGYDPFADRDVAIKVNTSLDMGDEFQERLTRKLFFNEAHTAGALDHPNIIKVLDAGEERGEPYIVMEYLPDGKTLIDFCDRGNLLPVETIAEYIAKCATALDYAHRRGVVHRDIKPTNIMLTGNGDVKIADFGIAQRKLDDTTQVMGLMGSPRYMSPEQTLDQALSGQTDIYSLGVVMFELLTGQPPFTSTNLAVLFKQISNDQVPDLRSLHKGLPSALNSIVHCAMEKDPQHRYQSGAEMANDLNSIYASSATSTIPDLELTEQFEMVRDQRIFNEFSDAEIMELIEVGQWHWLPAGQVLDSPEDSTFSYVVNLSGDSEVVAGDTPVATLVPGDCFGVRGSKTNRRQLRARNDSLVLQIDEPGLLQTSATCQLRFGREFLHTIIDRLSIYGIAILKDVDANEPPC